MSPNPISLPPPTHQTHLNFMTQTLLLAHHASTIPETPVACILVHNNLIIGQGINATNATYNGTRHAEFVAINEVLTREGREGRGRIYNAEILKACTLYVTVEPCIMCASLLRQFGVGKVVFGAGNERFGGTGGVLNIHLRNGIEGQGEGEGVGKGLGEEEGDFKVEGGWLREECILALRRFYVLENERAPEDKRGKEGRVVRLEVEPLGVKGG